MFEQNNVGIRLASPVSAAVSLVEDGDLEALQRIESDVLDIVEVLDGK